LLKVTRLKISQACPFNRLNSQVKRRERRKTLANGQSMTDLSREKADRRKTTAVAAATDLGNGAQNGAQVSYFLYFFIWSYFM
jgi:hypothetical protein